MTRLRLDARKFRSLVLNAGLVVAVFLVVSAFQSRNMLSTDGQVAPPLRGVTLSGEPYDLDNAGARPALVYFFAPWCKICAASADNLARLRRWRDADEIEILAVALDWATADEVRTYAERHGLNVTVVLGDATIAREWRVQAYPSYYVLDSERRIVRRDIGYSSQAGLWWRAWTVS
ncbi:MAG: TlpA family protein disulfide reductase [Gammaproteobacteria bacterium]|nr:TlpA family protein disulfide reductase [Gammaproteobacteria bacterium]